MTLKLGYWKIRGMGEPIKLILEYLEVPSEWKEYTFDNAQDWFANDKVNLGIEFPNLPYLIDGEFKTAQTMTILKYLGRKYGLFGGETNVEISKQEAMMDNVFDFRVRFAILCYQSDFHEKKPEFLDTLPARLVYYEERLANQKWLMGDEIFVGDFFFWSGLDAIECLEPSYLDKFPNVARFKKEFESLPQIDKYLKSDKFRKFPICAPVAQWGGKDEAD
ncbi:glutathione S-transferase Mu 6-like [Convolutriloba macropyga]|uniref:glutathione S-transferase Mu 6-like n=1 Tax=Convolutriloba macropyga TaxID=536237 RepID=UPI003F522C5C